MISTKRLRVPLGILGMLLPWIVLGLAVINGYGFPDSISATYYFDPCITPFMIILGASSILLMSYKGYDRQDDIVCTLAGIFGLMICLFPCAADGVTGFVGTFHVPVAISGIIHNLSAILFFCLLAYNSLFLFTKKGNPVTQKKLKRNVIFKVCGIGMIISMLCIIPLSIFDVWGGTWLVEAIALSFFGISWLTKSNVFRFLHAEKY